MGIRDWLSSRRAERMSWLLEPAPTNSAQRPAAYATPFRSGDSGLVRVLADAMDRNPVEPITREAALSLPAVAAARAVIVSRIASKPLEAYNKDGRLAEQPTWLYRTNDVLGPHARMARTLDDGIFYGHSLWLLKRSDSEDASGRRQILNATHCHIGLWRISDDARRIELRNSFQDNDWFDAQPGQTLYFPSMHDGLLVAGRSTIEGAIALENAWVDAASTPMPAIMLKERDENGLSSSLQHLDLDEDGMQERADDEISKVIKQVAEARRTRDGLVMYIPYWIEAEVVGQQEPELLTQGRNAARLDIAGHLGLPGSLLDATTDKSSLTYETQEGNRAELADRLPFWTAWIEETLSHDDVVPAGTSVRFDFTGANDAARGPHTED